MASRRGQRQDDTHFWAMKLLQEKPDVTQRELARALGISLGAANYCLQALVKMGWVKIQNFSHSKNKFGYVYLLTPVGITEKAALTSRFLMRKMCEYEALREEIEAVQAEIAKRSGTQEEGGDESSIRAQTGQVAADDNG